MIKKTLITRAEKGSRGEGMAEAERGECGNHCEYFERGEEMLWSDYLIIFLHLAFLCYVIVVFLNG